MTMEKPAQAQFPIHDLLRARWSPRAFSPRPVEVEKLLSVFEAARWAPSGGNLQPWAFVVSTSAVPEAHARMASVLGERNRLWAQHAPVLILTLAHLERRGGLVNRWATYDLGQAVAYMTLQAEALGLSLRQMGGFDAEKARALYDIPAAYEPATVIALGYRGDPSALPEEFRQGEANPRTRKGLEAFVFEGQWEQPAAMVQSQLIPE